MDHCTAELAAQKQRAADAAKATLGTSVRMWQDGGTAVEVAMLELNVRVRVTVIVMIMVKKIGWC